MCKSGMCKSRCVIDIGTEALLWQGRPAPRCYTLRHWRRALRWAPVFVGALLWQWWLWHARGADGAWGTVFLPAPLVVVAFALSCGRLLRARLEWEHVFYLISDAGVRIQEGRKNQITHYSYAELKDVRLELYHNDVATGLGWVHAQFGEQKVTLECLEDAPRAYALLAAKLERQSGR